MLYYMPILFVPHIVRVMVDEGRPGAYVLGSGSDFKVGYARRSDSCRCNRLALHNRLYRFEYFIYRYAKTPDEDFLIECEAYHALKQSGVQIVNKYHPAMPAHSGLACPYCAFSNNLRRVLRTS